MRYWIRSHSWMILGLLALAGCAGPPSQAASDDDSKVARRHFNLTNETVYTLNAPRGDRFEASGLLLQPDGKLLTVNNHAATLFDIQFRQGTNEADLIPRPNFFTDRQLAPYAKEKFGRYDTEGIARDDQGRLYICEEANRWILRCDPTGRNVERLPIDWTPVTNFFSLERNASFEGIAIGANRLYVANERDAANIFAIDLATFRIVDSFLARPEEHLIFGIHYSDLSWHRGRLFVLARHHRCVLEVDPTSHAVLAEYHYRRIEDALGYQKRLPTGIMEGLAVDDNYIWLLTDNNGLPKKRNSRDHRPSLVRCPRPKPSS